MKDISNDDHGKYIIKIEDKISTKPLQTAIFKNNWNGMTNEHHFLALEYASKGDLSKYLELKPFSEIEAK